MDEPGLLNSFIYGKSIDKSLVAGSSLDIPIGPRELFAGTSMADIVDIYNDGQTVSKIVKSRVQDREIREWLKKPSDQSGSRTRILFIDAIQDAPDKIPIREDLLRDIFQSFDVNPRFFDFLVRQHMPGRQVHGSLESGDIRHELWWSAVLRSMGTDTTGLQRTHSHDLSRTVAYWQRFALWSDFRAWKDESAASSTSTVSTALVFRCPLPMKKDFLASVTGPSGTILLRHPLSAQAFLMEHLVRETYDFANCFSQWLYAWENKESSMQTPEDLTIRSKAFLTLSRQMHQISTDHDILIASVQHLVSETQWFMETFGKGHAPLAKGSPVAKGGQGPWPGSLPVQEVLSDIFANLVREVGLIGTYMGLYLERSKIGVSECYAMINQHDAETNIQMGVESAAIARASHEDNRSLRIIQIMGVIFLPGSLVSSIFGMGFFSSTTEGQSVSFAASSSWWLYFAVTIPLTAIVMLAVSWYIRLQRQNGQPTRGRTLSVGIEGGILSRIASPKT